MDSADTGLQEAGQVAAAPAIEVVTGSLSGRCEASLLALAAAAAAPGLVGEPAAAAVRAMLVDPVEPGTVRELPRPGERPARLLLFDPGAASVDPGAPGTAAAPDSRRLAGLRRVGAAMARTAGPDEVLTLATDLRGAALVALLEGIHLGGYQFVGAADRSGPRLRRVQVLTDSDIDNEDIDNEDIDNEIERAAAVAAAVGWARDLTNTRASTKTPTWVAEQTVRFLRPLGVQVTVRDRSWLAEQQFGGVLAVGSGSTSAPCMVEAHWRPQNISAPPVLVVGKGITFDTGGYNLKPGQSMLSMYTDMAGGAAALAAMSIVARLRLPVPVTVLVPLADNAVSGSAFRPGDIVVHHGGRSSEITNTDAEGRLVLADALAYGVQSLRPRAVIDIATLTGAMRAALGPKIAGVIGDDDAVVDGLLASATVTGEPLWRLPLAAAEYGADLHSPVADAVNSTSEPPGAITAALFLQPFAGGLPWAHLDIAGTARASSHDGVLSKGATGFGTRLLAHWLESLA